MEVFNKNKQYFKNSDWTVKSVQDEINLGLNLLNKVDKKIITFFGSHRVKPSSKYYKDCMGFAQELGKKDYAVLSGGGPGIMHAANNGATKAGTISIGMKAKLLTKEKVIDPIYTDKLDFNFLFVRRFIMSIKSNALVFFPGGYGTLNELFEYAVLMQTGIVDKVPMICINKKFWKGLFSWLRDNPLKNDFFINDVHDLNILSFVDDVSEAFKIIESK